MFEKTKEICLRKWRKYVWENEGNMFKKIKEICLRKLSKYVWEN